MKIDSVALSGINSVSNEYPDKMPTTGNLVRQASVVQAAETVPPPEFHRFPEHDDSLKQVSERSVIDAIEKANRVTMTHDTRAQFSIHEKTKDIMIKIIDVNTNEVIREFPPEKFLDLIAKLWDLAGIVVDERR